MSPASTICALSITTSSSSTSEHGTLSMSYSMNLMPALTINAISSILAIISAFSGIHSRTSQPTASSRSTSSAIPTSSRADATLSPVSSSSKPDPTSYLWNWASSNFYYPP